MAVSVVSNSAGERAAIFNLQRRLGTQAVRRPDFSLYGGAESLDEGRAPRRTFVTRPTARDNGSHHVAPPQDPVDFLWLMTEEPHRSRRQAIMKAHPEVRVIVLALPLLAAQLIDLYKQVTKLMGHEPLTKWIVLCVIALQLSAAYSLRHVPIFSLRFLLTAYAIGGTANHNLFLAIHEITHNLAFKGIHANKALAVFANLPIGIPYAAAFKVRDYPAAHNLIYSNALRSEISYRASQVPWRGWC
jgi:sphingolipid 4-desaturase/C4-monooxygenase